VGRAYETIKRAYDEGYNKAIDDVLKILNKYKVPIHSDANYEILQLKERGSNDT
jgi:hypothetical protein